MLKVCGPSIYKPLEIIFNQFIETGDKQIFENYPSMSLLPICGKILERLMFNEMFEFLLKINSFLLFSLVLNRVIPASINYYLLLIRYGVLLMKALKLEVSSSISQRHLIRCGMIASFLN